MKRSLLAIISLILMCLMVFSSCDSAVVSSVQDTEITQNALADAEPSLSVDSIETEAPAKDEAVIEDTPAEKVDDTVVKVEDEAEAEKLPEVLPEADADASVAPDASTEENAGPVADFDADQTFDEDENFDSADADVNMNAGTQTSSKNTVPASKNYKGLLYYKTTDGKTKTYNVGFTLDYRDLFEGSNKTYSKNLSELSSLLSADVYKNAYVKLTEGATGGNDTATTFPKKIGLTDAKSYDIKGTDYSVDKDDVTQFVVGHKKMMYNGVAHEVIIVTVRGTNETNAEWSSNFDVGADTKNYYNMMGSSHPHWLNKKNHKGFDVAANRVYEKLNSYIKSYVDTNSEVSILITGHSRGAAIANILSQIYTDKTNYKTYGYTFATPNTTTASNAGNYKNIFNIKNQDDIIPYLPLAEWGFKNYGVTKSISVKSAYGTGLFEAAKAGSFKAFTGEDYNDDGGRQRTINCFIALAKTREDLYKLDTTSAGKFYYAGNLGLGYSEKDANTQYNTLTTALKNEKLLKFCSVKIVTGGRVWKYRVEVNYCPAYFMQMLANMTTGVGPLLGRDLTGKYNDAKLSFVASSGKVVIGGMEHPHMQPTYYLIVKNDFKTLTELNKK